MRVALVVLLLLAFVSSTSIVPGIASDKPSIPLRPVHTYSIVARDPDTGELGVAVQSHWFSVGPIVGRSGRGRSGDAVVCRSELRKERARLDARRQERA